MATPDFLTHTTLDEGQYARSQGPDLYLARWEAYNRLTFPKVDFYRAVGGAVLRPDIRVLDVGCGNGDGVHTLHQMEPSADITGLDIREEIFAEGKRRAESEDITSIKFQVGTMQDLVPNFGVKAFDVGLALFSPHHVPSVRFGLLQFCEVIGAGNTGAIGTIDPDNKPRMRQFHRLALEKCDIDPDCAVVMPSRFDTAIAKRVLPEYFESVETIVHQDAETRVKTEEDMKIYLRALASYRTACASAKLPTIKKWRAAINNDVRRVIEEEIAAKERNGEEPVFIDNAKRTAFLCKNPIVVDRRRGPRTAVRLI